LILSVRASRNHNFDEVLPEKKGKGRKKKRMIRCPQDRKKKKRRDFVKMEKGPYW